MMRTTAFSLLPVIIYLFFSSVYAQLELDQDPKLDYYCGFNWLEANTFCRTACPSGLDVDCPISPSGRKQSCYQGAGCFNRMETLYWTGVVAILFDREEHMKNHKVEVEASGTDDEENTAANDVVPTAALMGKVEEVALERTLISTLQILLDDKIYLASLDIKGQTYDQPCVEAVFPLGWDRDDPSKLALDVTMRITARYIPNAVTFYTDKDLGDVFISGLGKAQDATVRELKNANSFFNAVTGMAAVSEEDLAEAPSAMPSTSPTRDFDQLFEAKLDSTPTGSNGIVFSVKTPKGAPSVLLEGMKFVTNFEGVLEYEVYSKLGSWKNFVGRSNEFDLIASGQVTGKGPKTWVDIIQGDHVGTIVKGNETTSVNYVGFKKVYVLGDGGERSFYFTTTKRFLKEDRTAIPILFSSPINSLSESLRQYAMVTTNSELELYEGDGVLDYPWPTDPNGKSPYYRRPRGPIISFNYDRSPCEYPFQYLKYSVSRAYSPNIICQLFCSGFPNVNFTGWPCPYVQKTRKPTPRPSRELLFRLLIVHKCVYLYFVSPLSLSLWIAFTPRSTEKPTKAPTLPPTPQPTWSPTREPTIEPVAASNENATEIANLTFDNEMNWPENSADTVKSSQSKDQSGAEMKHSFVACKWHSALLGLLPLLWQLHD